MNDSSTDAEVIESYALFAQGQYYTVAARALFLWDYFVTFDREVQYIWGSRMSAASGLFILNRYLNLLISIMDLIVQAPFLTPKRYSSISVTLASADISLSSCHPLVRLNQSLSLLATLVVALFVTLRVYATWSRDWRPALPVLVLALVTPGVYLYTTIRGEPIPAPRPSVGCAIQRNIDAELFSVIARHAYSMAYTEYLSQVVILERATTTAYDFLVLLFTLMKTAAVRRAALSLDLHPNIKALLLRDGTVYFLLLLVMNLAQIIFAAKVPGTNWISFFTPPITSILITRFLLNLRQVAQKSGRSPSSKGVSSIVISTQLPSMRFSTDYLGNLGAPLRTGYDTASDDTNVWYEDKLQYVEEPLLAGLIVVEEVRMATDEVEMERLA
ncbi:hypothetical protein C8Q80DRAFT_779020 [Daedaleopsis nitida]|nr:hypothetical protein C8Q80DRAFT_779020 [Daedaleopsis nitida]